MILEPSIFIKVTTFLTIKQMHFKSTEIKENNASYTNLELLLNTGTYNQVRDEENRFLNKKSHMKTSEIRKSFVEWSLASTFHCYPKIFQYKNIYAKLLWATCFLIFSCMTAWLVVKEVLGYFEFDVVSKTRTFTEKSTIFPTVTICDANPFTTREAEKLFAQETPIDKQVFKSAGYDIDLMNVEEITLLKWMLSLNVATNQAFGLSDAKKQELGFSINKTLRLCTFNALKCTPAHFHWVYDHKRGNCFQFNSNKNLLMPPQKIFLGGPNYGLTLLLGPVTNLNRHLSAPSSGFKIFVHNSSTLSSFTQEIFVETGKQTNIAIKKSITRNAPSPHSECQELDSFRSAMFDLFSGAEYRQTDCFKMCLQSIIVENCKCFYLELPLIEDVLPCITVSEVMCLSKNYDYTFTEFRQKCDKQCPLECEYATYDSVATSLEFPSQQFYDALKFNSDNSSLLLLEQSYVEYKQSHALLNIFFPNVAYTEISQTPKTSLVDLISNLGGALGIFLGFSIFSCIELAEVMVQILVVVFCKKKHTTPN